MNAAGGMEMKYQVWVVPVPQTGNVLYKKARKVYETNEREDAVEFAYFENADDPAPDKHEFRRYEIREAL
jgi:hypothetical protein